MRDRLKVVMLAVVIELVSGESVRAAGIPRFAIEPVSAGVDVDAGVALDGAQLVRLSASGVLQSLELRNACPRVGPAGCSAGVLPGKTLAFAPAGALLAKFVDERGTDVGSWVATGALAVLPVPRAARRLVYRINAPAGGVEGAYRVVTDAVDSDTGPPSSLRVPVARRAMHLSVRPAGAESAADARLLLRRFAFGGGPSDVASIEQSGVEAWLDLQLDPAAIDDSDAARAIVPDPRYIQSLGSFYYDPFQYEAQLPEREYSSKRQLLEKVTLHWLEHFSVGKSKAAVANMARYIATLRRDALGNFTQLLIDVAEEPAMLAWLDNNENASSAGATPNENFARELLQLYVMGTAQLNADGTERLDPRGQPIPNYSQGDVTALATAMTGYTIVAVPILNTDPLDDVRVVFLKQLHAKGPYRIFGQTLADPGDATAMAAALRFVVRNGASIAAFQSKELIQRFVTETPSPAYVERIAKVWQSNAEAPDQIARVIRAIALDPEFTSGRGQMVKEPIEYVLETYRSLPVVRVAQTSALDYRMHDLVVEGMAALEQDLYSPESVFSFYRPGDKESLLTDSELLARWQFAARFAGGGDPNFALDRSVLATATHGLQPSATVTYLCNALVDGGTPQLRALLTNYLSGPDSNLQAALWLLLISPENEVN